MLWTPRTDTTSKVDLPPGRAPSRDHAIDDARATRPSFASVEFERRVVMTVGHPESPAEQGRCFVDNWLGARHARQLTVARTALGPWHGRPDATRVDPPRWCQPRATWVTTRPRGPIPGGVFTVRWSAWRGRPSCHAQVMPNHRQPPDLRSLFRVLVAHDVAFVVMGSTAALLRGVDLVPGDLDIIPALDEDNLSRLALALDVIEARAGPGRSVRRLANPSRRGGSLGTTRSQPGRAREAADVAAGSRRSGYLRRAAPNAARSTRRGDGDRRQLRRPGSTSVSAQGRRGAESLAP